MNWVDGLLVLVVGLSIVTGFAAGFARAGIGFIATILGIFLGFWFYGVAGAYVLDYVSSRAIANLIGFFAIFLAVTIVGAIVGRILAKFFKWIGLSWFDRLLGGAFGAVRGIVIAVALVTVLLAFAPSPPPRSITDSKVLPYIAGAANVLALATPLEIKGAFVETKEKAYKVWSENAKRQPDRPPEGLRRE